jgi:type I restriction enzyme S subunit
VGVFIGFPYAFPRWSVGTRATSVGFAGVGVVSKMSFMENLLDGVEVEWKPLGKVVKLQRGKRLVKKQLEESGSYAVYQNSMTPLGYYHESNAKSGTAFIISAGAAGGIGYSEVDFWAADDVYYFVTPDYIESKFLYHSLLTKQHKILAQVRRASIPRLSKIVVEKLQIPIPCPDNPEKSLEIQTEIVRILDTFTELTTELSARKKQYNYYRDQLLSFPRSRVGTQGEVEWKTLGDVVKLQRGKRLVKSQLGKSGNYAVYQNSMTPLGYYHENNVQSDTAFIISAGAAGEIGYSNVDFWAADDVYYLLPPDNIKSKFLYYFLLTQQYKILAQVRRASIPRLSKLVVEKLQIPIPALTEQARIVAILDKFDTLTHSISEGLPREIELRQKQYEYYRDLLLSFPKEGVKDECR